jgi:hypothetical protein
MQTKDYITISVTITGIIGVIVGWFINGHLNRKNLISIKRMEYQLTAYQLVLDVWLLIDKHYVSGSDPFADPLFLPLLEKARGKIQLYGTDYERNLLEKFIKNCEKRNDKANLDEANKALHELIPHILNKIRSTLEISSTKTFK